MQLVVPLVCPSSPDARRIRFNKVVLPAPKNPEEWTPARKACPRTYSSEFVPGMAVMDSMDSMDIDMQAAQ